MKPPEWFQEFANRLRVGVTLDDCGDWVCDGKWGHFSIYGEKRVAICCVGKTTPHLKHRLKRFIPEKYLYLECDSEAIWVVPCDLIHIFKETRKSLKIRLRPLYSSKEIERKREWANTINTSRIAS